MNRRDFLKIVGITAATSTAPSLWMWFLKKGTVKAAKYPDPFRRIK